MSSRLYLKVPEIDELDYRRKLLSDADTMSYNMGYGVDGTGCCPATEEQAKAWYRDWFSTPDRYYAYIMRSDDGKPVGDVDIHYDKNCGVHMVGVVIEAQHRGNGYSEEALCLLADKAFNELGLEKIADAFPADRVPAEKAFKKVGFVRESRDLVVLTKKGYEEYRDRDGERPEHRTRLHRRPENG
jgi:RimJ/RimL family protein N-acetyltransferase